MTTRWPVEVDIPEASILADYTGIEEDLMIAADFCDRLVSIFEAPRIDVLQMEALSTAAVIRYARCFTTGVRDHLSGELLDKLDLDRRLFHEAIFALRQRHYAHSVNVFEENRVVAVVSDDPGQTEVSGVTVQHGRIATLGLHTARALGELARIVLAAVRQTLDLENAKVLALARLLPYEELRKKEMPEPFAPRWEDVNRVR